jgi:hypothetical protein
MSIKTTVLWLLIAIVLGAAALLLLRNSGSGSSGLAVGDSVLRLDPARLAGVRIEHPDGSREIVDRGGPGGEWQMQVFVAGTGGAAAGSKPPAWPVPASRIEALSRRLQLDTKVRALAGKDAAMGDGPTIVTLDVSGGSPITLRLSDRSLAGTALIEVEDPNPAPSADGTSTKPSAGGNVRAMISDQVHALFRGTAPREWRDRTALPWAGVDVSRVRLTNHKGDIVALARMQGDWSIKEPFAAPADPTAVQRVLGLLGGIQVADFLDAGAGPEANRFSPATGTVVLESDKREVGTGPDAKTTTKTEQHTLDIGGPSDSGGSRLFARIDGERTVVIDARAVADLRLDPVPFVWPHPTRLNPTEIGTMVLQRTAAGEGASPGTAFRRDMAQWKQSTAAGESVVAESEMKTVEALLNLFTGVKPDGKGAAAAAAPAQLPVISAPKEPRGYVAYGQVRLLSLTASMLETIEVGREIEGKVVLKTGPVYRAYAVDRVPRVLQDLVAPAAEKGAVESKVDDIINK